MAVGLTGVPGVAAVAVQVREFSSVGENVQTQHPATGELTALERSSERETATLVIPVRFNFYNSETILYIPNYQYVAVCTLLLRERTLGLGLKYNLSYLYIC